MPRERRRRVVVLAVVVVLTACTQGGSGSQTPRASLPLEGTLLVGTGQTPGAVEGFVTSIRFKAVAAYDLATRRLNAIHAGRLDFVSGAIWTGPGTGVLMVQPQKGAGRLFLFDGSSATPAGPPFPDGSLLGVSNDYAVASVCLPAGAVSTRNEVSVLDLAHPDAWQRVGGGCGTALSADGSRVAVTRTSRARTDIFGTARFSMGTRVWSIAVDGSGPRELMVDVAAIPALRSAMIADPTVTGVAWGKAGLAVSVSNGEAGPWAIVLVPSAGAPRVVLLGQDEPGAMAWQPNGDLLAFTDCYQCTSFGRFATHTADIRVYDARTGSLRQIAAANNGLSGLVWSPSGDAVVTRTPANDLLFADATGRAVARRSIDALPEAWQG